MSQFLQVGRNWINLETVLRVEMVPGRSNKEQVATARVHFADGRHLDFRDKESIEALDEWLRAHEAE